MRYRTVFQALLVGAAIAALAACDPLLALLRGDDIERRIDRFMVDVSAAADEGFGDSDVERLYTRHFHPDASELARNPDTWRGSAWEQPNTPLSFTENRRREDREYDKDGSGDIVTEAHGRVMDNEDEFLFDAVFYMKEDGGDMLIRAVGFIDADDQEATFRVIE